ncbi:DUF5304 domain-containing protein [Streptomyces sp. HNM0574]|uniref:DUF5304 domain-containing protein n=1 Tax=Streptomyces sp. HNM0574 TaxID=2714954 RepID=UPI00146C1099|nr:DUF5304 domain-containing protein [Streptomyces sp. HNM0574]NLU67672.1 DUF5304 domain-containing protein [Streptomyces sp. HNM0574]
MSDAAEHPAPEGDRPDADAWATACEEDLASEKARRRAEYGHEPLSAAEELRRLADAVSGKIAELGKPLGGSAAAAAAAGLAQQAVSQARAAVEPVVERNPQVFDHLATAGGELLAAYRAAVQGAEQRWTAADSASADRAGGPRRDERIDLDPSDERDEPGQDHGGDAPGR